LFFGGWLSPLRSTGPWAWTLYLPAAVFVLCGIALVWDGVRYTTPIGKVELVVLGVALAAAGGLTATPFAINFVQGPFWFLTKVLVFLFIYVWVRGTLPRFRYDQLMAIGWKLLLPVSLANVLFTSLAIVVKNK
jgi:NADH-quinone oxidoreductase subunit H